MSILEIVGGEGDIPQEVENKQLVTPTEQAPVEHRLVEAKVHTTKPELKLPFESVGIIPQSIEPSVKRGVTPSVVGIMPVELARNQLRAHGLTLEVETRAGDWRKGVDMNGNKWRSKMPFDYGFIHGIDGADGDELDVFIGPDVAGGKLFRITQNNPLTGEYDEDKIMMGFRDAITAERAYRSAYDKDWGGFGGIREVSLDKLRR